MKREEKRWVEVLMHAAARDAHRCGVVREQMKIRLAIENLWSRVFGGQMTLDDRKRWFVGD